MEDKRAERMRRTYEPPQIYRVDLNHEQAILSACSTGSVSPSGGSNRTCKSQGAGNCRKDNSAGGDSGPRS